MLQQTRNILLLPYKCRYLQAQVYVALGQPGVCVKRNKRLNRIAKASPAPVVRSDDNVPDLVNASSDDDSAP
jgi:hypothetical protein